MSTTIKYTKAERKSFEIVPETCPAIEQAFEDAFAHPSIDTEEVIEIFAKYNIVIDKRMTWAIHEVLSKDLFRRKHRLLNVVRYEGTFPLRTALVEKIETEMMDKGEPVEQNHYRYWLETGQDMLKRSQS